MNTIKTLAITAGLMWTLTMYPIYPLLGLLAAMIAISAFFNDESNEPLAAA